MKTEQQKHKKIAVKCLKKLGLPKEVVNRFKKDDEPTVFWGRSNCKAVGAFTYPDGLLDTIKEIEAERECKVYAVIDKWYNDYDYAFWVFLVIPKTVTKWRNLVKRTAKDSFSVVTWYQDKNSRYFGEFTNSLLTRRDNGLCYH